MIILNNKVINKVEYINNLKNEDFENFNLIEIIKITKILGIPTPKKENRLELLKRIKKYIDGYSNQNQNIVPSFNKFNSTFNDLQIKDGLEIGEKLFWMVFKNKVLFKSITFFLNIGTYSAYNCNFGFGKQYFKYDEINDVKFMLDNNYLFMLKEKVFRGDILVFSNSNSNVNNIINNKNGKTMISPSSSPPTFSSSSISNKKENVVDFFQEIIKRVKQEKYQQENSNNSLEVFYQSLFQNYSKYIISYDSLVMFILNHSNINALKVLVHYHPLNYKLSQTTLLYAIQNSFFKGVRFIVDHLENENYKILPIKYSCFSNIKTKNNTKLYKIIIFLFEKKLLSISNYVEKDQWYYLIKDLIKEQNQYLQLPLTEEQQLLQIQRYELYMELPKPPKELFWLNLKLKDLLNICKLISLLSNGDEIKNEFFEKTKFKNQDLKLKLKMHIIKYFKNTIQPHHEELLIIKPLKFYLSEIDSIHHLDLMDCFFNNSELKEKTIGLLNNNHLPLSLRFGCFTYWIQFSKYKYKLFDCLFDNTINNDDGFQDILFQHVHTNEKDRKIIFINQVSEFINQNYNKEKYKTNVFTLLYLVIGTDDIEMVKLVERNFNLKIDFSIDPPPIKIPSDSFFIQKFIKSVEMLDYCFINFKPQFLNSSLNHCFFKFKSFQLFKRFEKLLLSSSPSQLPITFIYFNSNQYQNPEELIKMFKYVVEKSNLYSIGFNIMHYIKVPENIGETTFVESILPDIQFIICNFSNSFIYNPNEMFSRNYQIIKFLDWVKQERQIDINSNRCTFNFNIKIPIINIGLSGDLKSLESFIQNSNKISSANIINEFNQDVINFKTDLILILQGAAKNGQLKVFEHLFYNHPNLLIKKSKKIKNNKNNNGLLFNFRDFWFVFYNAIQKDNIHVLEFIIDVLHYKKPNQFQYYFNEYPLINKFFNKLL